PFAGMIEALGWRGAMALLGAVSAGLAALLLVVIRDPPRVEGAGPQGLGGFAELLRLRVLWPILPLALANYAVAAGLRGLWIGPYLLDLHAMSNAAIGLATTWMALAMVAGNFVYGPLDRLLGSRKWLLLVGNALGCIACGWLWLSPTEAAVAVALLAAIGFFGSSYAVLSAHFAAFVPARLTGRGVTLINVFGIGGVGLGQFATGALFDAAGGGAEGHAAVLAWYTLTLGAALFVYVFSRDAPPARKATPR
ncbi:MAG: MFS transporter, partial [Pseudomonadota bacterium]